MFLDKYDNTDPKIKETIAELILLLMFKFDIGLNDLVGKSKEHVDELAKDREKEAQEI